MPPVIIAVAAAAAAYGAGIAVGGGILGAVVGAIVASAVSYIGNALLPQNKPKNPDQGLSSQNNSISLRQPIAPHQLLYGQFRVGGTLTFTDSDASGSGANTQLNLVYTIAAHAIDGIDSMFFANTYVPINTTGDAIAPNVSPDGTTPQAFFIAGIGPLAHYFVGQGTVSGDDNFNTQLSFNSSKWTETTRQAGRGKMYVRLFWNQNVYGPLGVPNAAFVVRGRRLFDPRAPAVNILDIDPGSPGVIITDVPHDCVAGDEVWFKGVTGITPVLSQRYEVGSAPTTTSLTLIGTDSLPLEITGSTGMGGTLTKMTWTDNAMLVALDYTCDATYGLGTVYDDEIVEANIITGANVCDEMVPLAAPLSDTVTADATTDTLTLATLPADAVPGIFQGQIVTFSTTGTLPAPLAVSTVYYLIPTSEVDFHLATTLANAIAGTLIDITDAGTGTHTLHARCVWTPNPYPTVNPSFIQLQDKSARLLTGTRVTLDTTGTLPAPFQTATEYFAVLRTDTIISLAASLENARNGIVILPTNAGTGTHFIAQDAEPRYTANGPVDTTQSPQNIIAAIVGAMAGYVVPSGSQVQLFPAAYRTPTVTLDEDDLDGPIRLQTLQTSQQTFNSIKGTFTDPFAFWQPTDVPAISDQTYIDDDAGEVVWRDVTFNFTVSSASAQRLMMIELQRARREQSLTLSCKFTAFQIGTPDVFMQDFNRWGLSSATFEVQSWGLAIRNDKNGRPYLGCNINARQTDANVYAWDTTMQLPAQGWINSTLPDATTVLPPTNITFAEMVHTTASGSTLTSEVAVTFTGSADSFTTGYAADYSTDGGTTWKPVAAPLNAVDTNFSILSLSPGDIKVRVKAINGFGTSSPYLVADYTVLGIALLPALNAPQITSMTEMLVVVNQGQGVNSQATVNFSAPTNTAWADAGVGIAAYYLEWSPTGQNTFTPLSSAPLTNTNPFQFLGAVGIYDFRIKAQTSLAGVFTPYSNIFTFQLNGLTAAPSDLTGFAVTPDAPGSSNGAYAQWDAPPDLDVKIGGFIVIRYSTLTSGSTWEDGTQIGKQIPGSAVSVAIPLLTGTYMAKVVDSTGNYSTGYSSVVVTSPGFLAFSGVESVTESPTFPGHKHNVFVEDDASLQLDGGFLFDSIPGLIDTWSEIDWAGGIIPQGDYEFANLIDLGGVYAVRLTAEVIGNAFNTLDEIDNWSDMDSQESIDGDAINYADAQLYVSITNDNPTVSPDTAVWGPYQPFYIGDYVGRAFRFKLILESQNPVDNFRIVSLSVSLTLPQYTLNLGNSISIASGGSSLSYSSITGGHPFFVTPTLHVTPIDLQTGDFWTITSSSRTGFSIRFFNALGIGVARHADVLATGFGQQVA